MAAATLLSFTLCSPLSELSASRNRDFGSAPGTPKTPFLPKPNLLHSDSALAFHQRRTFRRFQVRSAGDPYSYIPRRFREENLADGLMENYKNVPKKFYGLKPSQINMFMTEDSPIFRQRREVTEESISSARNYLDNSGMFTSSDTKGRLSIYNSSVSRMSYGGGRGSARRRGAPPDLPSLLLDSRICYLGMPIVPAVAELIVAQLMWLDYDDTSKPIYIYINSSGTQNSKGQTVGSDTDAFAIANAMLLCRPKIYTVNIGQASGHAAMILGLGAKGYRALYPLAITHLRLPRIHQTSGPVSDMWIRAKELDVGAKSYVELLAKGTGKQEDEIATDIQFGRLFRAKGAIDYGIADRIIQSQDKAYEQKNYDQLLAEAKARKEKRKRTRWDGSSNLNI